MHKAVRELVLLSFTEAQVILRNAGVHDPVDNFHIHLLYDFICLYPCAWIKWIYTTETAAIDTVVTSDQNQISGISTLEP